MIGSRLRGWAMTGALVAGLGLGAAGIAQAASGGTHHVASSGTHRAPPAGNPAAMKHGPGETLLTGSAAAKARAAALAAVPGATVIRVETDSGPAAYEAHLRKADGSYVTVKMDTSFTVIATQAGFGQGGGPAPPSNGGAAQAG
jgi:hypothetical protein